MKVTEKAIDLDLGSVKSAPANPPARSVPRRRGFRRIGVCLLAIACLAIGLTIFHAPILTELAELWVVDEPITKADAIVVLGGGADTRPLTAAKLYHEGVAPKVLYMDVKVSSGAALVPDDLTEKEFTRRLLLSNSIPEGAIESIGKSVANTYDESLAVRAWAERNGAKSIVITTDVFHTRRARWIFHHELHDRHIQIHVRASPVPEYRLDNWWQQEDGLIAFQNEVIKFIYYHIHY